MAKLVKDSISRLVTLAELCFFLFHVIFLSARLLGPGPLAGGVPFSFWTEAKGHTEESYYG